MITLFIVLGILLLAIPLVCVLFLFFTKAKRDERVEVMKRETLMTTTIRKGENGRTVFENKVSRSTPQQNQSRRLSSPPEPILPCTTQQALNISQPRSMTQRAWQRLSRPFHATPAVTEDDCIELHQKSAPDRPAPHCVDSPISPIHQHLNSSSSWRTIDRVDGPVSPLDLSTNVASSSISEILQRSNANNEERQTENRNGPLKDMPLTPPPTRSYGQSGGRVRARTNVYGGEEGGYDNGQIKTTVLNRDKANHSQVQLQEAPQRRVMKEI